MGQQREAEAMGWMARNTGPNAPPQRPGKGAAGACVSLPGVNYVGGSRQLRRRVPPCSPPAMAGGGDSEI
jgi:hypothetical protein